MIPSGADHRTKQLYEFGPFRVDPKKERLLRGEESVPSVCQVRAAEASDHLRSLPGANATEMRGFANPFLLRSSRPFVSSGCLPLDYWRAPEVAERKRGGNHPFETRSRSACAPPTPRIWVTDFGAAFCLSCDAFGKRVLVIASVVPLFGQARPTSTEQATFADWVATETIASYRNGCLMRH